MAEIVAVTAAATIASGVMSVKPLVWDPIKGVISAPRDTEKIHEDLKESMEKVTAKKGNHEKYLASCKSTKRPSIDYNNWIQEVAKLEKDVEDINAKYETKSKNSKFLQSFTCSKLRKKMRKLIEVAAHLEGKKMGDISTRKEPDRVVKMKEAPDIKKFPTLSEPLTKILSLLTRRKIKGIELHGMMGTGKTTIMQNLNNHEKVTLMFDIVIWVNVSTEENKKNFSVRQMQQNIVHRLNLDGEGADDEVAKRIKVELRGKKCLLLLDGVKEDLKLSEIGIDLNYENGSKMVLTTRNLHVCDFIVDRVVRVGRLSDEEATDMFKKVLGQSTRNIGPIMAKVIKCCDNLPFVIKMIASAFKRRESEESWVQGYYNLRKFPNEGDAAIQKVYNYLEFCCNDLESAQKDCFLYCALYPEEMEIGADHVLDCWGAEDLYGINNVREYGRHILDELKKVSLLEERLYGNVEYVKMHKLIRKVALDKLLADIERKHLVKTGESLQDQPSLEEWNEKHRISLVDNQITTLSQCPDCPLLSTLLLQGNESLKKIHNSFFENTKSLRVLDLCRTGILSLPSSVCKLKLLKVLYLNGCTDLVKLPSEIGELGNLEVLDVRGIGDANIPSQNEGMLEVVQNLMFRRLKLRPCTPLTNIEKMRNLKRLLVSFNVLGNENDAQYVSNYCNVISQVSTTLEELVIDVKSYKQRCSEMINMVREKVTATMPKLTTLKFCFEDGVEDVIKVVAGTPQTYYPVPDDLTNFVRKLDDSASKSFQLFIGCSISSLPKIPKRHRYKKYLKYCDGRGSNPTNISKVLSVTDAFELVNHKDLVNVSEFGNESLYEIQGCLIEGCSKITGIADGDCVLDGPLLPSVMRLYIKNLPKLESIWKKALHLWSLSELRTVYVDDCPSMEALLVEPATISILPNLRKLVLVNLQNLTRICTKELPNWPLLEELKIQKCPKLAEFPFTKDNTYKLKKLILDDMPNLQLICAYESLEWPALEKLKIYGCPSLTELPFNNDNANNLIFVKANRKWWEGLQWKDLKVKERLEPYCSLQEDTTTISGNNGP